MFPSPLFSMCEKCYINKSSNEEISKAAIYVSEAPDIIFLHRLVNCWMISPGTLLPKVTVMTSNKAAMTSVKNKFPVGRPHLMQPTEEGCG